MKVKIFENKEVKALSSIGYNFLFNKENGQFARWGKTKEDDPEYSPFGPEILDLELSVNGCPNNCKFCYKNNTNEPATNMSLETFKTILSKFPKNTLTQIAFGITGVQTNPDFIKILKHTRENGIIPNFTLSGIDLTDEIAIEASKLIGAVAVSAYQSDKNICYNTVKKFLDLGVKQTNIHLFTSRETKEFVYEVLNDIRTDKRLEKLNAVVFLKSKPKGRANGHYSNLNIDEYVDLVNYCIDNKIQFGFDSCTCADWEIAIKKNSKLSDEQKKQYVMMSESCESFGLFSSYVDVFGDYYPCSFAAGEGDWKEGLSVINCKDFLKDIWYNEKLNKYRKTSLTDCYSSGCRKCLIFPEINPKE